MNRRLTAIIITSAVVLTILSGCSKKKTRIEPASDRESPRVVEPVAPREPEYKPSSDDRVRSVLVPVYFDYDKHDLKSDAIRTLERIAQLMKENNSIRLLAEGHCDERGSSGYNMGLGENRAKTVRSWLTTYGISGSRLETTSYGKERPASFNCSDESCHSNNRRVEWKLLSGEDFSANW